MQEANTSPASELERIAALRERGILTDDEFTAQKARILGAPAGVVPQTVARAEAASDGIGDLWVYVMIALPLLAAVLVASTAGGTSSAPIGKLFVLPNLVLVLLDHGRLKAADRGLPVWQLILGILLTPAYLFFRARRLGSGYGYIALYVAALLAPLLAGWSAVANYGAHIDAMPRSM